MTIALEAIFWVCFLIVVQNYTDAIFISHNLYTQLLSSSGFPKLFMNSQFDKLLETLTRHCPISIFLEMILHCILNNITSILVQKITET